MKTLVGVCLLTFAFSVSAQRVKENIYQKEIIKAEVSPQMPSPDIDQVSVEPQKDNPKNDKKK